MIDQIICALLLTNFKLPCYLFVWYFNPIDALGRMRPVKGSIMMAVTSISIFMKEIQTVHMNGSRDTLWEQSLYFILLQIALFLFLNLWEQYQRKRAENVALSLQEVATKSLLKNIQARQEHDESIRQLRHDLKNHLLTLHLLLEKGDTDAASQYVETFLDQVSVKRFSPQTGHELLDGVLAEKLDSAISQGIQVSVNLDFRKGGFIQNFDLCTVMGNVLDNAVESALKAVSRQDRFIDIRGGYSAGCLVIHISNGFLIPPVMTGHLPCTTKENPGRHGFGLRNVEQTLKKYGGSFNISVEDGNRFVLAMLIPVPVEE